MDIVIVAQYMRNIENIEQTNSRFWYIANLLKNAENEVEIVTSDFNHEEKSHFKEVKCISNISITMCHESGYAKNVCLKRFSSHSELSRNIRNYLSSRKKPDILYAAIPSLAVAEQCAEYCNENKVRFIVDIQDLWPEAFKMALRIPVISDIAFWPMMKQANKIYRTADEIVSVSKTYADRAMRVNKKCKKPTVVYLGTQKKGFEANNSQLVENVEGNVVGYVGRLSDSYDLKTVIDAMGDLTERVKLLVMGDGPLREIFERYAEERHVWAEFTGMLPYDEMVKRLVECTIAVNPIRKGSAGSIINKVGDYAMAGLPVVNTQECQEYRKLLKKYNAGINCECESRESVLDAIKMLLLNEELRREMSVNSLKMGRELFDRDVSYQKIVGLF